MGQSYKPIHKLQRGGGGGGGQLLTFRKGLIISNYCACGWLLISAGIEGEWRK